MLKLIVGLASILGAGAYSGGARDCQTVNHGTFKSPIPADWTLSLLDSTGAAVTTWSAGQTYTAQITGTTTFKGWSWAPLKGTPSSFPTGSANMAGSFAPGDSYSHSNTGCAGSITQTSANTRTTIKAVWTPPAAGTGTVSLWSMMVISKNGNNYNAVLTVPEAGASSPSGSPVATVSRTVSASKGASATATSSSQSSFTETATPSPTVKNSPSAGYGALPSSAPQQVIVQTSSSFNMVGVAIGGAMAGAVLLAVVGPVVHHILNGRRRPISTMTQFNLPPQQVVTSNPLGSYPAYSVRAT